MTTKRENGIHLVQECVAGENTQDCHYPNLAAVFPAVLQLT